MNKALSNLFPLVSSEIMSEYLPLGLQYICCKAAVIFSLLFSRLNLKSLTSNLFFILEIFLKSTCLILFHFFQWWDLTSVFMSYADAKISRRNFFSLLFQKEWFSTLPCHTTDKVARDHVFLGDYYHVVIAQLQSTLSDSFS